MVEVGIVTTWFVVFATVHHKCLLVLCVTWRTKELFSLMRFTVMDVYLLATTVSIPPLYTKASDVLTERTFIMALETAHISPRTGLCATKWFAESKWAEEETQHFIFFSPTQTKYNSFIPTCLLPPATSVHATLMGSKSMFFFTYLVHASLLTF